MNKNRGVLILFLSLGLLWFISPPLAANLPFINKNVILKPKNPKVNVFGKEINLSKELKYGLDLQGGSSLTFGLDTSKVSKENQKQAVESAREVVEKRVNFFGTTEPSILLLENAGKYKIMVDM